MGKNRLSLWYLAPRDGDDLLALLNASEHATLSAHPELRLQQLSAWAMRRQVLRAQTGTEPQIERHHSGRPYLASGPSFSTAHTPGLVVLAVAPTGALGVDVERLDRSLPSRALAQRFLPPEEQAWLDEQNDHRRAFIDLWVLKEAMVKAQGLGLAGQLKRFTVRDGVLLNCPTSWGTANSWMLESQTLANHRLGLALSQPMPVTIRRWAP
jgi:4'-phosphopantetheinyl transferase